MCVSKMEWLNANSFFTVEVSLNHAKILKMGIKLLGISADPTAAGKNCHHPTRTFVAYNFGFSCGQEPVIFIVFN